MKHKAIVVLTAIVALTLSACTGVVSQGTETDNTDIMVPTNIQKVAQDGFVFEFDDNNWEVEEGLVFRSADANDDSYVAVTILENEGVTDYEAYAEATIADADFTQDSTSDLPTVVSSKFDSGARVDDIFVFNPASSKIAHLRGVFTGVSAADVDFPINVAEDTTYEPLNNVKVCTLGACGTKDSELKVYGEYTPYSAMIPSEDLEIIGSDDEGASSADVYELSPSVQPQIQVQQIAPITVEPSL